MARFAQISYVSRGGDLQMYAMALRTRRMVARLAVPVGLLVTGGCASLGDNADFDRHRYSQLVIPMEQRDLMYFDVTLSERFPKDDPAAEAQRMAWLETWLARRGACPQGYDVVDRRPFGFLEHNPARHDLRYEIRCARDEAAGEQ